MESLVVLLNCTADNIGNGNDKANVNDNDDNNGDDANANNADAIDIIMPVLMEIIIMII